MERCGILSFLLLLQCLAGRLVFSCQSSVFSTSAIMFDGIVDEYTPPNFVETRTKVFKRPVRFSQPHHLILNAYSLLVLEGLVAESPHMA